MLPRDTQLLIHHAALLEILQRGLLPSSDPVDDAENACVEADCGRGTSTMEGHTAPCVCCAQGMEAAGAR